VVSIMKMPSYNAAQGSEVGRLFVLVEGPNMYFDRVGSSLRTITVFVLCSGPSQFWSFGCPLTTTSSLKLSFSPSAFGQHSPSWAAGDVNYLIIS
jgi:hypothetical protein